MIVKGTAPPLRNAPIQWLTAIAWLVAMFSLGLPVGATAAGPAPVKATAKASATLIRPVRLSPFAALSFGRAVPTGTSPFGYVTVPATPPSTRQAQSATLLPGEESSPLVIAITGEPGRSYRITVPVSAASSPGNFAVSNFTVWTLTSRDVTVSKISKFNALGGDIISVGGKLAIPRGTKAQAYTAQVPVAIAYE
jgi:hypothetical protein